MNLKTRITSKILLCLLMISRALPAPPPTYETWIGKAPESDMNDAGNWSHNSVPTASVNAIFDSEIANIDNTPTTSGPLDVLTFSFVNDAYPFTFLFPNQVLTIEFGIIGTHTNATFNLRNSETFNTQLLFNSNSHIGSAIFNVSNTLSPLSSEDQVVANGSLTALDHAVFNVSNVGISSENNSHEQISYLDSQLLINNNLSGGNDLIINITNNGSNSGTSDYNTIAMISFDQLYVGGVFNALNNTSINVLNSGTNSGTDGHHTIGTCQGNQAQYVTNFLVEDCLKLHVSNTGLDNSSGPGFNSVGVLSQSDPSTGVQLGCHRFFSVGDFASIVVENNGTNHSTNVNSSNNVIGAIEQRGFQFLIGDFNEVNLNNTSAFSAGNHLSIAIANTGFDNSAGIGQNNIGVLNSTSLNSGVQLACYGTFSIGDNASIVINNEGTNSGTNLLAGNNFIGAIDGHASQFQIGKSVIQVCAGVDLPTEAPLTNTGTGVFSAGDNLFLNITNAGLDNSASYGFNQVGTLAFREATMPIGDQLECNGVFSVQNNAVITISNTGINSCTNPSSIRNSIGALFEYADQFYVSDLFSAGDNLKLSITNAGIDNSAGMGANSVGTLAWRGPAPDCLQLDCDGTFSVGNNASINISNSGTNSGTNLSSGDNAVGYTHSPQVGIAGAFKAKDYLLFNVSNIGVDTSTGRGDNYVGCINSHQLECRDTLSIGNHGTITIINQGLNSAPFAEYNRVGFVEGNQFLVHGPFSAGTDLKFSATNVSLNTGQTQNSIGFVNECQFNFMSNFTAGDGTILTASNNGYVGGSQIWFQQGFTISSGQAVFQAFNKGIIGGFSFPEGFGIYIQGASLGGNALIELQDSSLYIDTISATTPFTIGGLNGDIYSTAQSSPPLNIYTDLSVSADFLGVIEDFSVNSSSSLLKSGLGTQKLSGLNTYTGLTTVQQGTLILSGSGSLAGDVTVTSLNGFNGLLKGVGTIGGSLIVENGGIVMPGQSVGTLPINGDYLQDALSKYVVQVDGAGQSSLLNIGGTASFDGSLEVVSVDGAYSIGIPYLILTAHGGITPDSRFQEIILNPLLVPILNQDLNDFSLILRTDFMSAAKTVNQQHVAMQIDFTQTPTGDLSVVIDELLSLNAKNIPEALNQLAGTQFTFLSNEVQYSDRHFSRIIFDALKIQLDSCFSMNPCNRFDGWVSIEGGEILTSGSRECPGMHAPTLNLHIGGHIPLSECALLGAAMNFDKTWLFFNEGGHAPIDTAQGALYISWKNMDYYLFSDLIFGYSKTHVSRPIKFGNVKREAVSTLKFFHGVWYGEWGMNIPYDQCLFKPFIGIDLNYVHQGSAFERSANSLNFHVHQKKTTQFHTYLGSHFHINLVKWCALNADIAWQHRFGPSGIKQKVNFIDFGGDFSVIGSEVSRDGLWGSLNVETTVCNNLSIYAEFSGEWWNCFGAYSGSLGTVYCF